MIINYAEVIPKIDAILERGLCRGIGARHGVMCIEAALCAALDLPHGDNPECVAKAVRTFEIGLNDAEWSSPIARAKGLRDVGIAQLGSKGVVDNVQFITRLSRKIIRRLIPALFREIFPWNLSCLIAADECERKGTEKSATEAARAARAAWAAETTEAAAAWAAWAAEAAEAAEAAGAAAARVAPATLAVRATETTNKDTYLIMVANLCLETLRELGSPGAAYV